MLPHENLSPLFTPTSIAIIGASASEGKIGHTVLKNLLDSGFAGRLLPVNPKGGMVLGLPALCKTSDIPGPLDLAIICVPAAMVEKTMEELACLPTRAVVIYSAGFKETGARGAAQESVVKKLAKQHHMAVLGPNCLGFVHSSSHINATFVPGKIQPGSIGFFSQSGALCAAIFDWAESSGIGFSAFISLGNKAIIDESDILSYLADDPATKVILGYLESIESGPRFMRNAHKATREKPVILLRAGRTHEGGRAAAAHTGAQAGENLAYEAALHQTGICAVTQLEELFQLAQAFASQPLPQGPNVAIVTNAGGPGILATDACEEVGLTAAKLSRGTIETLRSFLPSYASVFNPVDVIPDASAERLVRAADTVLADPNVHALVFLVTPNLPGLATQAAEGFAAIARDHGKPVFACLIGGKSVEAGKDILTRAGIPCYSFPEPALGAIAAMHRFAQWQHRPLPVEITYRRDVSRARAILREAYDNGMAELSGAQAHSLLTAFEMPMLASHFIRSSDESNQAVKITGLPAQLMVDAHTVPPLADQALSCLNLNSSDEVRDAFHKLTAKLNRTHPEAQIKGCLVQAMPPEQSLTVAVGFRRDAVFGPLVYISVSETCPPQGKTPCRVAPLSLDDAHDLARILQKSLPPNKNIHVDDSANTALEDILLILSQLALDNPELVEAQCACAVTALQGVVVTDARFYLIPADSLQG